MANGPLKSIFVEGDSTFASVLLAEPYVNLKIGVWQMAVAGLYFEAEQKPPPDVLCVKSSNVKGSFLDKGMLTSAKVPLTYVKIWNAPSFTKADKNFFEINNHSGNYLDFSITKADGKPLKPPLKIGYHVLLRQIRI